VTLGGPIAMRFECGQFEIEFPRLGCYRGNCPENPITTKGKENFMIKTYFNFLQDFDDSYNKYKEKAVNLKNPPHTGDIININGFYHYVVQAVIYPEHNVAEVFLAESSQDRATALQAGLGIINEFKNECDVNNSGHENYGYHFEALNAKSRTLQNS
jgi:hypothetical protein